MPFSSLSFFLRAVCSVYFGTREHLIPRESLVIYLYVRGISTAIGTMGAMDPAWGFFYLCQIIAIGSSGRNAGKHSRYLQIAMRHARASAFFTLFRARFRRDTPSLGNGLPPGRFFHPLPRGYLSPVPKHLEDSLSTSQSTSVAQFTSISLLFSSSFSSILSPLRVQIGECRCQFSFVYSSKILKMIFYSYQMCIATNNLCLLNYFLLFLFYLQNEYIIFLSQSIV